MGHADSMRCFYDLVNSGDIDGFVALMTEDFVDHQGFSGLPHTREGVRQGFTALRSAFPDLRFEVEDVIEAGDKAVARCRMTGTHQAEFMGIAPTGKRFDADVIDIVRFDADGKAVEHWGLTDSMAMMQQLGAVPEGVAS